MKTMPCSRTGRNKPPSGEAGMTLVEVAIALSLTVMMCGGVYTLSVKAQQFAEHNRVATEAHSLAKERMEEIVSYGAANLDAVTFALARSDTNESSTGWSIVRQPVVAWHAADGSSASAADAAYAEVLVRVTYTSPLTKRTTTDALCMLVEK
jgi:Tfp pilus assembly protein PilV